MFAAGSVPKGNAPAGFIASRSLSVAAVVDDAPSSAHENPPNAIMLVLAAALMKVTTLPSGNAPEAASAASDQNTIMLDDRTNSRLQSTGRSRKRVAFH